MFCIQIPMCFLYIVCMVSKSEIVSFRSKIILLQSEREKMALEANFSRERLDSFMKEFEHQACTCP